MIESRRPALPANVLERIAEFLGPRRALGAVRPLPLGPLVADYCELHRARWRRPPCGVHRRVARVASGLGTGRRRRDPLIRIGPGATRWLGDAVLLPAFVGAIDDCSYSITPYCDQPCSRRWIGRWQRWRLTPAILRWLAQVARQTAREIPAAEDSVRAPLQALARHRAVDAATRRAASAALDDFDGGRWRPRSVVAHNELWWGNFVHRADGGAGHEPFYVIDWAGGRANGVPFYDLVRVASSLRVAKRTYRQQVQAHSAILECRPADSLHYLSLAFATLARDLGEWPEEQFALTATAPACDTRPGH